jgi:hypothetical protein
MLAQVNNRRSSSIDTLLRTRHLHETRLQCVHRCWLRLRRNRHLRESLLRLRSDLHVRLQSAAVSGELSDFEYVLVCVSSSSFLPQARADLRWLTRRTANCSWQAVRRKVTRFCARYLNAKLRFYCLLSIRCNDIIRHCPGLLACEHVVSATVISLRFFKLVL